MQQCQTLDVKPTKNNTQEVEHFGGVLWRHKHPKMLEQQAATETTVNGLPQPQQPIRRCLFLFFVVGAGCRRNGQTTDSRMTASSHSEFQTAF
jgi:hypothetical protein